MIDCPNVVQVYNAHMGGVDLQDCLSGLCRCSIRSKKWYHRIFYHMLDVAAVNSWLLYRRSQKQLEKPGKMPLLEFKTEVANALSIWENEKLTEGDLYLQITLITLSLHALDVSWNQDHPTK
ncbi:hypothetical protein CBL_08492 [Carabus blaptoides fortunei]